MPLLFRSPRRRVVAALVAAAAGLSTVASAPADAAPLRPTREARAAGVQAGNATMGWRQQAPDAGRSAPSDSPGTAAQTMAFVPRGVLGIDVSSWQGNVNWEAHRAAGKRFAYVKATEGLRYKNPYFSSQYTGSYRAGMIRGAYHFALPHKSSGRAQAAYFARSGGGWSADGRTLPGVLDIEYNPYGSPCYGLSKKAMRAWVKSFITEYKRRTSRDAVIYTTTDWWTRCTGNSKAFSLTNPLWLARYGTSPGTLPGAWTHATFWQYTNVPLDQNRFSSTYTRLKVLATDPG
jgi:GH25 family lysozyme M1 (1,4-beta-N-acetylmuramidase)